jgi:hypothetical protein
MARLTIREVDAVLRLTGRYYIAIKTSQSIARLPNKNSLLEYIQDYEGPVSTIEGGWWTLISFGNQSYAMRFTQDSKKGEYVLVVLLKGESQKNLAKKLKRFLGGFRPGNSRV